MCVGLDVQSRVVLLPGLWSCCLCVYLLSLLLYLVGVRLPQVVCSLDVCWRRLRLCALGVRRTRRAISVCTFAVWYGFAALCVGLDMQSRVVLLPGLWSCWLCVYLLGLCMYLVGVRLPQVVCAPDVCWLSLGLCALGVRRTRRVISICTIAV